MTTDLFWEPYVGEKVVIRQSAMNRHGGVGGCDGPHTVMADAGQIDGFRIFWIRPDGPAVKRTNQKGRVWIEYPTRQTPAFLEELEPMESTQ